MNPLSAPDRTLTARFAADLDALVEPGARIGVAVSGGPDSLALLLLAAAARTGRVEAATVDHRLRPESRSEAELVASVCATLDVPHAILPVAVSERPRSNLQAWARDARYNLLCEWAGERRLDAVATAHHVDDQAETLLLRIARGSGVGGLAGVHRHRLLGEHDGHRIMLVRPVLDWRRSELRMVLEEAGLRAVDDPSNADDRFDRTRARALLESTDWLDPHRLAAVAQHCIDAERALEWAARDEFGTRRRVEGAVITVDPADLPRELRRRLLLEAIQSMTNESPPGPKLIAALDTLEAGGTTTLSGLKLQGGATWRISPAPARRR